MLLDKEIKQICIELSNKKEIKDSKQKSIIHKFKNQWMDIMTEANLYNKLYNTYSLNNLEITEYGIKGQIYKVPPLTYDKLQKNIDIIEENLGCCIILNNEKGSKWINSKFVFNQNKGKKFKVVEEKCPYKAYLSNDYSGNPILADLRKHPHILITGTTRSGKSKLADCVITNLVNNCTPKDLQLYLFQVAKNDLCLYEDLEHTMAFADTLDKTLIALNYINDVIVPQRNDLIKPYRKKAILDNIWEYNDLKKTEKYPMILLCFDEMASIFQTKGDQKPIKEMKDEITRNIQNISQYGASLGIFLLSSIQRPTMDMLPPFIKSQSNTIISLRQANSRSSEVATDDSKLALGLKQREFVYKLDEWDYGLVPLVDNKEIYSYIKPFLKPNHRTLFDDLEKLKNRNGIKKNKEQIEIKSNFKTENEILEENISKINDFVPYDNHNGMIIKEDKPVIKTEKSKGMVKVK